MATEFYTLAQLVQRQKGIEDYGKIFNDIEFRTPLLDMIPSRLIGDKHSVTVSMKTSIPMPQSVPYNAGMKPRHSSIESRSFDTYPYGDLCAIDEKMIRLMPGSAGDMMREEMQDAIEGFKCNMERSLFYGSLISDKGVKGLMDMMGDFMTTSADPNHNTTETREHSGTSVWIVCTQSDKMHMIYTGSNALSFGPEFRSLVKRPCADGVTMGDMPAVCRSFYVAPGFVMRNDCAAVRLVNVSDDHPLTDSLLARMVELLPNGLTPSAVIMNKHALATLQKSRAAQFTYQKKTSGSTPYASLPTDYEGLPIKVSDALINNETLVNLGKLKGELDIHLEQGASTIKR